MNIEEIRKNAPIGATHYQRQGGGCRYLIINKNKIRKAWCYGQWVQLDFPCGLIQKLILRIKPL